MADYNWSTTISPLPGVPLYDFQGLFDLPEEFHPRDSYDKKLSTLIELVKENFAKTHLSKIKNPTPQQISDVNLLASMYEVNLRDVFFKTSKEEHSQLKNEYSYLYEKVKTHYDNINDTDLEKYDNQYKLIEKPYVADYMYDDDFFAYWRLTGNNPLAIKGISVIPDNFPITDEIYQNVMGDDDNLEKALADKRLYLLDYKNLAGATAEEGVTKPEDGGSNTPIIGYSYMAIAMFAVSKKTGELKSVAIQCGQSATTDNPIFTPSSDENYRWGWERAKLVVHSADKAEHQLCHHLGITHLISEVFSLATMRNFRTEHPIYRLLISHIEGTNRINHNALLQLLAPQQFVDNLIAAELGALAQKTIETRLAFDFYENFLPTELARRQVDDVTALPDYPYRDDGLLIWNAINEWVSNYIKLVYPNDFTLNSDAELNAWMQDIVDNGRIKGFKIVSTREDLSDVLTMVIFTSSAQHAAVNFPQKTHMMYAPAMVGTLAASKPNSILGNTKEQWLAMLPGTARATDKIGIYTLLAGVYNGYLGEYIYKDGSEIFKESDDKEIYSALTNFREKLKSIEAVILERNEKRYHPYETLIPKNIPASVNI